MRLVPIESIREGSYLARTIFDDNGRILLKEGIKLTSPILKRLKYIQIYSLYVQDNYSDIEIEDIIKPELRQKSIKIIKETFTSIERLQVKLQNSMSHSNKRLLLLKKQDEYFSSIYDLAQELIDNVLRNKSVMVSLVDIKSMDSYTYQHCVNVAVLSLVLGIGLQLNKFELRDLCVGALIHDIGKVFVSKDIILKEGPLTKEEFIEIKTHSLRGYDYLRNVQNITSSSRMVVLQHHERQDGKGYPEGIYGDKINKLAKIVAIADVYDALTSHRPYRRAMVPNEAMEYIMGNAGTMFDYNYVKAFSKVIVPYPSGTVVKLSNGDLGVVEETPLNFPLRPDVRIIKSLDKSKIGSLVKLVKELSVVISDIEYDI